MIVIGENLKFGLSKKSAFCHGCGSGSPVFWEAVSASIRVKSQIRISLKSKFKSFRCFKQSVDAWRLGALQCLQTSGRRFLLLMDPEPNFSDKQCPGNVKVKSWIRILFISQHNFCNFSSKWSNALMASTYYCTLENLYNA